MTLPPPKTASNMNIPKLKTVCFATLVASTVIPSALCQAQTDQDALLANEAFEVCRNELREDAVNAGYSKVITETIINQLQPLERVIKLDRKQPEFTESFAGYISKRVNKFRIEKGQQMLKEHALLLAKLAKEYKVPERYIVAFWGLETNYGSHKGSIDTLNALASLACDKRRSRYFNQELLNLFSLIDQHKVDPKSLQGSWAGAMGHMQFMPTTLKTYGVDGDNDGKLDIWQSLPDALASAANYLHSLGWNEGEIWGRSVELPKNFAYEKVQVDTAYPLRHFKQLGITKRYQRPLPDYDTEARLILPSGHQGPAFLVYDNYSVFLKWNYSQNYALAVGLLADQFIGISHGIEQMDPAAHTFTSEHLKALQTALAQEGFDIGTPDGVWGPKSRAALQTYQQKHALIADGFPNDSVFQRLKISLAATAE